MGWGREIDLRKAMAAGAANRSRAGACVAFIGADPAKASPLASALSLAGYGVLRTLTAEEILADAAERQIDLVVIEADCAHIAAHDLIRELRAAGDLGIILIGSSGGLAYRIISLELGADDFLSDTIEPLEFLSHVRALLRRIAPKPVAAADNTFRFNGWSLETRSRRLTDAEGRDVYLTAREFEVLELLLKRANQVVPREELQGSSLSSNDSRAIDALIARLRRKLRTDDAHERAIQPVRNMGYVLALNVEAFAA